ncbi:MAG: starch-binding protein, partial [Clostridia bacterium]|nr:starch-binding protein [Clostridia bacterium]
GTLTLSYVSDGEFVDETTEPTTQDTTTTDPVSDTYTITFTNNKNWSNVNCYYWGTNDTTLSTWPGEGMTYSTTSDYGEKIYTIEIPNTADHIIFNDGGSHQTVDITITGSAKYYISGGFGKAYTVATWE